MMEVDKHLMIVTANCDFMSYVHSAEKDEYILSDSYCLDNLFDEVASIIEIKTHRSEKRAYFFCSLLGFQILILELKISSDKEYN